MTDVQTSAPPQKRPRSGPGTWARHYCDPAESPKHAKGHPSPRTAPEREPRAVQLELPVVQELAAVLGPHARYQEPPTVVADVLLRVLPMPDCARSTIAIVVHRKDTGTCDDLTYRQAGALSGCDRRTAINRFARTEGYGFIRVEPREYPYGGAAPNSVTATIPLWVYQQVDEYHATPPVLRPPEASALPPPETPNAAQAPVAAGAPAASEDSAPSAAGSASALVGPEPSPPERSLSPEDAAVEALLVEIHAFTRQRFHVAAIRGLNATKPKRPPGAGVPSLDDEQILVALREYIKNQRPLFERKVRYRERLPDRAWVECGIHVYLWQKRALLDGLDTKPRPRREPRRPTSRPARASTHVSPSDLLGAGVPVRLGAELEHGTTIVRRVHEGGIAATLGLQPGDKVVRVDDRTTASPEELRAVLSSMAPGPHRFELVRSNEVVTATVTLEARGPPPE